MAITLVTYRCTTAAGAAPTARVMVRDSAVPVVADAAMDLEYTAPGGLESGFKIDVNQNDAWDNPVLYITLANGGLLIQDLIRLTAGGGGGGSGVALTAQEVRDAMKLAPSVGAPASDSIDGKLDSLSTGTGATLVNHDTGGGDNLAYKTSGGAGIEGATIRAYLTTEYDAGVYTQRGQATTDVNGRWVAPMYLDGGNSYTFTFEASGYGTSTKVQVV